MRNSFRWAFTLASLVLNECAVLGAVTSKNLCASATSCGSCAGVFKETYCYWCKDSGKCMNENEWLSDELCMFVTDTRSCALTPPTANLNATASSAEMDSSEEASVESGETESRSLLGASPNGFLIASPQSHESESSEESSEASEETPITARSSSPLIPVAPPVTSSPVNPSTNLPRSSAPEGAASSEESVEDSAE